MRSVVSHVRPAPGRLEQRSTRIVFFIAGFGMAAWAPLVPFAKARAGIGDGALGLLLLCLGVGSTRDHVVGRRACRAVRVPARRHRIDGAAVPRPAPVGDGLQPGTARCRAARVRRQSGRDRRHHEHPGDHRRTGERAVDDVGIPRPVQHRRHCRCRLRRGAAWRRSIAARRDVVRGRRHHCRAGDGGLASASARQRTRGSGVRHAARRCAVHRRALLHRVPGGRRHARLERCVPHVGSRRRDGIRRPGLRSLLADHVDRAADRRPYRAAFRRQRRHRVGWHLRSGGFRIRDAGSVRGK